MVNIAGLARQLDGWRGETAGDAAYRSLSEALKADGAGRTAAAERPPARRAPPGRKLGVSRITVTAALDRLRAEGFVVSRTGSGTVTALPYSPAIRPDAPLHQPDAPGVIDMAIAVLPANARVHAACPRARGPARPPARPRLGAHGDRGAAAGRDRAVAAEQGWKPEPIRS